MRDRLSGAPKPAGVLVHIGAGLGLRTSEYLEAGFRQIILIEPNPECLPTLRDYAYENDRVTVVEAAVAPETGPIKLNVLNFADQSSLREPTALKSVFPGVKIVGQPVVDGLNVEALMESLPELKVNEINWLVIDAPGEEYSIIESLATGSYLYKFECLEMYFPDQSCFQGALDAVDIIATLNKYDYRIELVNTGFDPDWPQYIARLDSVALQNKITYQKLTEAERAHVEALKVERATFEKQLEEATEAHEAALASALAEAEQAHVETLKVERATFEKQLEEATEAHEATLAEAERSQRHMQSDLAVSLRMQALIRSDCDDLKDRFRKAVLEKTRLEELLEQLTQKLGTAAESLRQLPKVRGDVDVTKKNEKKKTISNRKKTPL